MPKKKDRKRKQRQRERAKTKQSLKREHPQRLWKDRRRRRRKKDPTLGMPFIIAFHGDPAQTYYCADYPSSFELIPRTTKYPWKFQKPFSRLKHYMWHHVTCMHDKVLIYKAGKWNSPWDIKKCFKLSYGLLAFAFGITIFKLLEEAFKFNLWGVFVFMLMLIACFTAGFLVKAYWKYYTS